MKKITTLLLFIISIYSFGQTATYNEVLTKQKIGNLQTYITENGEIFSVGDTITIGVSFRNEQFDFIQQNAGIAYYPLLNTASGSRVVIKSIKANSKIIIVNTTKPQGLVYGLIIINFENSIKNGEIISKIMSSDKALTELKKYKDKLDLGLITQEEFNAKKIELSKYIK